MMQAESRPFLKFTHYVLLLLTIVPILGTTYYVATRANAGPVGDQWWDVSYIAIKTRAGQLTPEDIFVYSAGHRPVIIRLMTVAFTLLTNYNVRLLSFVCLANALVNLALLLFLLRTHARKLLPFAAPLFALVLFTLYHDNSWLDYYFAVWQQPLFFLLLAGVILQKMRPDLLPFALVVCCAVATTFTFGLGIAAWFTLPVAIFAFRAYRRWYFLLLWIVCFALCMAFFTSNYAVNPNENGTTISFLETLRQLDPLLTLTYLLQYQSARFDTDSISLTGLGLCVVCAVIMLVNSWYLVRRERGWTTAAIWGSLALFAVGGAGLTTLGRGVAFPVPSRYSPGADGFWIAFVALACLTIAYRPKPILISFNLVLIVMTIGLTLQKDVWLVTRSDDLFPKSCDQCTIDYPLQRGECFRACFIFSDAQSVYQMAALRLSVFGEQTPVPIVPASDVPVITDMPNRWLSTYVRDYMLSGNPPETIYSIAPVQGVWQLPLEPYSPFYRGELSTDDFPHPLTNIWENPDDLIAEFNTLFENQTHVWYLNAPETAAHYVEIANGFSQFGYRGQQVEITVPRYANARFGLWCFAVNTEPCTTAPYS